jgi:dipeptidase E
MKYYLSSFKIGDYGDKLAELIGLGNKIAVIPNALDFATDLERKAKSIQAEIDSLTDLGIVPEVLDLTDYFGKEVELESTLNSYKGVWVRGGNVFVLRAAMRKSGLDNIIKRKAADSNFVYAGYSAGACVLAPSLQGSEIVDDVTQVEKAYGDKVIWEGLGLMDFLFEPHYKSDHPESADIDKEIEYLIDNKILFKAFRDGEVLILE